MNEQREPTIREVPTGDAGSWRAWAGGPERILAVGDAARAVRLALRFPDVHVRVYADGWRDVDDARAMIEAHGLADRVVVRHRDARRAAGAGCIEPGAARGARAA